MKTRIHRRPWLAVVVVLACAMAVPMALAQSPAYNNGSLKGAYGFLTDKWTSDSAHNADSTLGVMTFDGAGNVSGSFTDDNAGNITTGTLSGTYSVKSNGTGSMSLTLSNGAKMTMAMVLDAAAKSLQLLATNCDKQPCPNVVVTATASAQVSTSFSNASLKGVYGWLANKWTADPNQQADATIGIGTFDGAGNMKVSGTDNTAGTVKTFKLSGTYSVNSDGTGSWVLKDSKGNEVDGVFVINAAGKAFQYLDTTGCNGTCGNYVKSGAGTHQ